MSLHKVGFIGAGNMCQSLIEGWLKKNVFKPNEIFVSNRTPGKVKKLSQQWGIQECATNEQVVESAEVVILAMKPQDLVQAVEPLGSIFNEGQLVVSLAAGISLSKLKKILPKNVRIIRVIPSTPVKVQQGVIGYATAVDDVTLDRWMQNVFSTLGQVIKVQEGDQFEALIVACASGVGFVFELMLYWQEWLEERGFEPDQARNMTVQTFLGAANLAAQNPSQSLEDLLSRVTSKKGTTAAGLDSMRELEVERLLRYSFEKSALRDRELAQD